MHSISANKKTLTESETEVWHGTLEETNWTHITRGMCIFEAEAQMGKKDV